MMKLATIPILITLCIAAPAFGQYDRRNAVSPDGRYRAFTKAEHGAAAANGDAPTSLWIEDLRTHRARMPLRGRASSDPHVDTTSLANPDFSLDGGYVYVEAAAYATSPTIHQVNIRTGGERYVVDGGLIGVLRSGPMRGYLVVQQHRYRPAGGSYDPILIYRPDGREIIQIPGSVEGGDEALHRYLTKRRWTMR